jgi:hypothetical protein
MGGAAGSAGAGGTSSVSYLGQITCVDSGGPTVSSPLNLNAVDICVFHGPLSATPNTLVLGLRRGGPTAKDHLEAQVVGLTKEGDYPTDPSGLGTTVDIAGFNDKANPDGSNDAPGGTSSGGTDCHGGCTVAITDAAGVLGAASGDLAKVAGKITCTSLAAAGVGCVQCTIAPTTIAFTIPDCIVD